LDYIIDGYNLFFQLYEEPTEENRLEFISIVSDLMESKNLQGEMIFDMPDHHQTLYPHRSKKPPLTLVSAPTNMEADDLIVEKLYAIKNPKMTKVVTNDRALITLIKDLGVDVISGNRFLQKIRKKKRSNHNEKPSSDSSREHQRLEEIFMKRLLDENE
jgi:predicted RNA-binding protein with PIN domain